ncbi:darcynin family protein [Nocardia gipuzkoensis]
MLAAAEVVHEHSSARADAVGQAAQGEVDETVACEVVECGSQEFVASGGVSGIGVWSVIHLLTVTFVTSRVRAMDVTNASSLGVEAEVADCTAFTLWTALPDWLALSRPERRRIADAALGVAFADRPSTAMRFFDAEAFSARCSNIAVSTTDPAEYYPVIERLRDSALFTTPDFRHEDLILAAEDGHRAAE